MDTEILIVGAGVSGLVAAQALQAAGRQVLVVDKGRSVGGRMATRRIQGGLADHGAQFITVRTPELQQAMDRWLAEKRVQVWGYGWSDGSLQPATSDGHPRYVVAGGMNALTVHLAEGLNVRVNTPISALSWDGQQWLARLSATETLTAGTLLLTPPVPQALALLHAGQTRLADEDQAALEQIKYGPCLCGLFVVEGSVTLPAPGALQDHTKTVYWVADNQRKGISARTVLTLHTAADYSRAHYDDSDEDNLAFLRAALAEYLSAEAVVVEAQLKKWRYSVPLVSYPAEFLRAQGLPLWLAGDAFGGRSRVEGAFISGLRAAESIMNS